MRMELYSIASGSSGNCIYVASEKNHFLVDAGISRKRIEEGLHNISVDPASLDGVFITHEHADHIQGLGVFLRKYPIPVYATEGTIRQILKTKSLGKIDDTLFQNIQTEQPLKIGDMQVLPVPVSHDAAQPAAYRFDCGEKALAVLTDLGVYDEHTVEMMQGLSGILVEANHDVRMLQAGSYPYFLKQRILGEQGHLSNEMSGQLLCRLIHDKMQMILLGHLSHENNLAELAFETVRQEIAAAAEEAGTKQIRIEVADRAQPTPLFQF